MKIKNENSPTHFLNYLYTKMDISILNINKPKVKLACFDYDWTLVKPKENRKFPKNPTDWQWLLPSIPDKLRTLHEEGYLILVFTNQTKTWKLEHIQNALNEINIPITVYAAMNEQYHKPSNFMLRILPYDIDETNSFFVGDAAGRHGDFSDSDKVFAQNCGLIFKTPEEFFIRDIPTVVSTGVPVVENKDKELVIMCGFPGSGKSTFCQTYKDTYGICHGDELKTVPKTVKKIKDFISEGKSVVIDATNSSIEKRATYVELAKDNGYSVKCVWLTADETISFDRNRKRGEAGGSLVPKIAYSVYKKHFQEPTEAEGFELLKV